MYYSLIFKNKEALLSFTMKLKEQVIKEHNRTTFAFKELKVNNKEGANDLYLLAKSYFDDANYFYDKNQLLEAFELFAYTWGLLDAGARLGLFNPGKARKHYKVEQDI